MIDPNLINPNFGPDSYFLMAFSTDKIRKIRLKTVWPDCKAEKTKFEKIHQEQTLMQKLTKIMYDLEWTRSQVKAIFQ